MGVTATVHLKIDTGMERIGVHYYSARGLLERAADCARVRVEGIYSHFANADAADLTRRGCSSSASRGARVVRRAGVPPPVRHIANSGAVLQLRESHLDLVRPGILLYGVYPSIEVRRTIPVARRSRCARAWSTSRSSRPASGQLRLHVADRPPGARGHGAGGLRRRILPRALHRGDVLIRGQQYPVVGRVCMDQIMVNLEWETAYNGDEVMLLGADGDEDHGARTSPNGPAPSPTRSSPTSTPASPACTSRRGQASELRHFSAPA